LLDLTHGACAACNSLMQAAFAPADAAPLRVLLCFCNAPRPSGPATSVLPSLAPLRKVHLQRRAPPASAIGRKFVIMVQEASERMPLRIPGANSSPRRANRSRLPLHMLRLAPAVERSSRPLARPSAEPRGKPDLGPRIANGSLQSPPPRSCLIKPEKQFGRRELRGARGSGLFPSTSSPPLYPPPRSR
jgi:hypothetical protein